MRLRNTTISRLLAETVREWREDHADRLAAALAYYTMFALAPLLIVVLAIAGVVFGDEAARGALGHQIQGLIGGDGAALIEDMVAAARRPAEGRMAALLGFGLLLFGATGVFGQLQDALNTIWEVVPRADRGLWRLIRTRFLSFTMVLGTGFLLLVSLVLSTGLTALQDAWGPTSEPAVWLWQGLNMLLSLALTTLLFGMIYNILPDVDIAWRDVWLGALITAVLFGVGKQAIGLYLGHSSVASAYGAAGSLVVILLWVYYSAQILFFGAELTQVYANRHGSGSEPSRGAAPVTEADRAQQGMPHQDGETTTHAGDQAELPPQSNGRAAEGVAVGSQQLDRERRRHRLQLIIMAIVGLGTFVLAWRRRPRRAQVGGEIPQRSAGSSL
jgi:membrane protein